MSIVNHQPFTPTLYTGRNEQFENERACYWYELVSAYQSQKIGLVGFACDQGVLRNQGRIGAKHAPDVIRQAFAKLPCSRKLLDQFGCDRTADLATLIGDMGNVQCVDNDELLLGSLEETQQAYANNIAHVLNNGQLALGLGGGHAIAYASFLGLWQSLSDAEKSTKKIGVINFDPHLDIRQSNIATSGTPFRQIAEHLETVNSSFNYMCIGVSELGNTAALFDRADELGVQMISDRDCYRKPFTDIATQIQSFIDSVDIIYLTIDMDCFHAGTVPGVSATAAKGLMLDFVEQGAELIIASKKVKVVDLAEINPNYDIDGISAKVAARLVAEIANQIILGT